MLTKSNYCGIMEKERMFYIEAYAHQLAPQIIAKNSARSACFAISKGEKPNEERTRRETNNALANNGEGCGNGKIIQNANFV